MVKEIKERNGSGGVQMDRLPTQKKYEVDLVYIQDERMVEDEWDYRLGLNCPNCGAPIAALGAKVCEY